MEATKTIEQTGVLAIRLLNFMAFEDTDWIELKPITLLFGRNSSGKSAIIRALRLLKQSLQADSESGPLLFRSRTGLDQGTFKNTVHLMNGKEERYIVFSFRCGLAGKQSEYEVQWLKQEINELRKKQGLEPVPYDLTAEWPNWLDVHIGFADIGSTAAKSNQEKVIPALLRIESPWRLVKDQTHPTIVFAIEKLEESPADALGFGWHFWSDVIRRGKDPWPDFQIVQDESGFWPMPIEEIESMPDGKRVNSILAAFREGIEVFLKNIEYLGPLRPEPRRIYALTHPMVKEWRRSGLGGLADFLSEVKIERKDTLDEWINELCLGQSIEEPYVLKSKEVPEELEILARFAIKEKSSGDIGPLIVNLADLGSGVAQVLPVLLLSLYSREKRLIIVEQPELHLHPSAQTKLADLFVESLFEPLSKDERQREQIAREPRDVRFLIETHSEHVFLRLRRWIAQSSALDGDLLKNGLSLALEKLAVYFVHRENSVSEAHTIKIARNGDLKNKPEGFQDFFADDMHESVKLAKERLKVEE